MPARKHKTKRLPNDSQTTTVKMHLHGQGQGPGMTKVVAEVEGSDAAQIGWDEWDL